MIQLTKGGRQVRTKAQQAAVERMRKSTWRNRRYFPRAYRFESASGMFSPPIKRITPDDQALIDQFLASKGAV